MQSSYGIQDASAFGAAGLTRAITGSVAGSSKRRFASSFLPAAAVTAALYFTMTGLIRVNDVQLVEQEYRPLPVVTPTRPEPEPPRPDARVPPPEVLDLPPVPPMQKVDPGTIGMPVDFAAFTPDRAPLQKIDVVLPAVKPVGTRIATPVRPPVLSYPSIMAAQGMSGTCDVRFSLSTRGLPFDIVAKCSHPGFEKEARRAVSRTEFLPTIQDGEPVESHNLVYPLEFRMQ